MQKTSDILLIQQKGNLKKLSAEEAYDEIDFRKKTVVMTYRMYSGEGGYERGE